jgi:hypothetical protein
MMSYLFTWRRLLQTVCKSSENVLIFYNILLSDDWSFELNESSAECVVHSRSVCNRTDVAPLRSLFQGILKIG